MVVISLDALVACKEGIENQLSILAIHWIGGEEVRWYVGRKKGDFV